MAQTATEPQTIGANCTFGIPEQPYRIVRFRSDGYFENGVPAGFLFFEFGNGSNFNSGWATLDISTLADGKTLQASGTANGTYCSNYDEDGNYEKHRVAVSVVFTQNIATGVQTAYLSMRGLRGDPTNIETGTLNLNPDYPAAFEITD